MSGGIPIRLVRVDGNLIELMATDFALDVDRGVSGQALWFTGSSRFAFDTNTNAATIIINGIVTDDGQTPAAAAQAAIATIDFSIDKYSVAKSFPPLVPPIDTWMLTHDAPAGPPYTVSSSTLYITLKTTGGTEHKIYVIENSSSAGGYDGGSSRAWFAVYNESTGVYTNAQIATNFKAAVDALPGTPFGASLKTSEKTGEANVVVEITQTTAGKNGNNGYPLYVAPHGGNWRNSLSWHTVQFNGGKAGTEGSQGKSAGDKVMDLYSIANNSNDPGFGSLTALPAGLISILQTAGGGSAANLEMVNGDYIIGIQIPFDSMINADTEKYKSVNFFMPTGNVWTPSTKSSSHATDATEEFNSDSFGKNYTGIKGTIQKITFTKFAGEPVYGFNLIFAPIDFII